jgi:hypothetical protein
MRRLFRLVFLMPALLVVLPVLAADILNPDKPDQDPVLRLKLLKGDYLTGKLTEINADGEEKTFSLEVTMKSKVENADQKKRYTDLYRQYADAYRRGNQGQVNNLLPQLKDAKDKMYEMQDVPYDFLLKAGKNFSVRRQKLLPKEEDGKVVPYTEEERKKLKGDPKLPGYMAEVKDLDKDIPVRVYLDKVKLKLPAQPAKGKKKDKDEDKPEEPIVHEITMIMILPPPADSPLGSTDPQTPEKPEAKQDPKYLVKLLQGNYLEGKLTRADTENPKGYTLEIVQKTKLKNPEQAKRYGDLYRQYYQSRDANQAKQIGDQLRDAYSKLYDNVEVPYEFQLEAQKDFKVRFLQLPPKEPGDDGKPGKYTAEERAKAKGDDPKLLGYTATVKDLDKDIYVRVYLDKSKVKIKLPAKPKPGDKDKPKDEEPEEDASVYPMVMIVILPPPPEPKTPK